MTMKRLSIGLLMTLVVSMAIAPALSQDAFATGHPNLITNGSFEADIVNANGGTWELFPTITGWTVTTTIPIVACAPIGEGELQTTALGFSNTHDGINYMEMDAICPTTISQDITTVIGYEYDVSYYTMQRAGTTDASNGIAVYLDGNIVDSNTVDTAEFVQHISGKFTATSTTTQLKFVDTGVSDGLGTFLDNIVVSEYDKIPPMVIGSTTNIVNNGDTLQTVAPDQYIESCTATDENSPTNPVCTVQSGSIDTTLLGLQSVTYEATDDAGNTGTDTVTTTVVINTFQPMRPNLSLVYNQFGVDVEINPNINCVDGTLTEPSDYEIWKRTSIEPHNSWTSSIQVLTTITAEDACATTNYTDADIEVGEKVRYRVVAINIIEQESQRSGLRDIIIPEGNMPVIVINGASQAIAWNAEYVIPTATCTDVDEDGNIPEGINEFNSFIYPTTGPGDAPGDYVLIYECTDSTGNQTTESITITRNRSGGGSGDDAHKTAPTFGIDWNTKSQLVEGGVTFNRNTYDVDDNFHTDFKKQGIMVGVNNVVAMKVYAQYDLKWVEFIFDVPETGAANNAKASIFVPMTWMDTDEIDQVNVKINQDVNLINVDKLEVLRMKTTCTDVDVEKACDLIAAKVTFNEQPASGVFAFKAVDERNRSTTTYFNDGIEVTGDSLNPLETILVLTPDRDHRGLVTLTQVGDRYDNLWASADGYTYEVNQFGTLILVDAPAQEARVDRGEPNTRTHSAFGELKFYESERAKYVYFNADDLVSVGAPSFAYEFPTEDSRTQFLAEHDMLGFTRGQ